MPSTYSSNLRLELMATGENRTTWGIKANNDFELIEDAIAGYVTVPMLDNNVTLSALQGTTDQSRNMMVSMTGANTAIRTVTIPSVSKVYFIGNNTTGGFAINVKTASGNTLVVANGLWQFLFCDGTNVNNSFDINVTSFGGQNAAYYRNADNINAGTLNEARLPASISGNKTWTGFQTITTSTAAATAEYLQLRPSDYAVGKPLLYLKKPGVANAWEIGLFDTVNNAGNIHFNTGSVSFAGSVTGSSTLSFTGNITSTSGAVTGVGGLYTDNEIFVRNAGDRYVRFQTAAGVNRGTVVHNNSASAMQIFTYNTSGVLQNTATFGETGTASWSGSNFVIGGGAAQGQMQLWTSDTADSYRIIGDNGGGLFVQRSTDRFATNATSLLSWNTANDATFAQDVYARRMFPTSDGDGLAVRIGNDAWIGDINVANTMSVRGASNAGSGWIRFGGAANSFGIDAGSPDIIRYASWSLQTDGNQFIPYAGLFLHQMFEQKAGLYTGSTQDELNFPIGHQVLVQTSSGGNRNATVTIYLLSTGQYQINVSGTPLTGTWRIHGILSGSGYLAQRVS